MYDAQEFAKKHAPELGMDTVPSQVSRWLRCTKSEAMSLEEQCGKVQSPDGCDECCLRYVHEVDL